MLKPALSLILILAVSLAQLLSAQAASEAPYLFVLDLDRVILKDKSENTRDENPRNLVQVGSESYQLAAFAPEFLMALKFHFSKVLGTEVILAIFSGGTRERNMTAAREIRVTQDLLLYDLVSEIRSFEDLKLTALPGLTVEQTDPSHVKAELAKLGGPSPVSFFDLFFKDLSLFGHGFERMIIFDDNVTSVPDSQKRNLLTVARVDIDETKLTRQHGTTRHWAEPTNPTQIRRTRDHLVRAAGVLSFAIRRFKGGEFKSLPDAIEFMQWRSANFAAPFRTRDINAGEIHEEGLRIFEQVYHEHLAPRGAALIRPADDFKSPRRQVPALSCDLLFRFL